MYDVTILTTKSYLNPTAVDDYIDNILTEDRLVQRALEKEGYKVTRKNWDNPDFDWSQTKTILFRTVWDYFERYDEFEPWLDRVSQQTHCINPIDLIKWNIDKHYLGDLKAWGVNIVPTIFIEKGDRRSLCEIVDQSGWQHVILKPAISGTARHTYKFKASKADSYEDTLKKLIVNEAMLLQPFINSITTKGEVSHMVFGGKYSHSVLKKAKRGDFRVQDDFGGTVSAYEANEEEMAFAEHVIAHCKIEPLYARVDTVWDNDGKLAVAELEAIEPELWFRFNPKAATQMAQSLADYTQHQLSLKLY